MRTKADFDAFYEAHVDTVYGYALRLCGRDPSRAEDLTQETWVALVRELNAGHVERADIRWLLTVARSRFIDQWRRAARQHERRHLAWAGETAWVNDTPDHGELLDNLAELEVDHRLVLILKYVDGLTVAEVAALVNRSTAATYSLLARARQELRERVEGRAHG